MEAKATEAVSGVSVPPHPQEGSSAVTEDSDRQAIILEFEKAAIDQIQDEKYWADLMERARILNVIHDPAIPTGPSQEDHSLFGAVRANNIEKVRSMNGNGRRPRAVNLADRSDSPLTLTPTFD
jgi:hypothetical protein